MAGPRRGAPADDVLRSALQHARGRDQASLRALAERTGLSAAGVLKILKGSALRPATREKLLAWYMAESPLPGDPELPVARHLFERLLPGLGEGARARRLRELARRAADDYRSAGAPPPRWLADLLDD